MPHNESKSEFFFEKATQWKEEFEKLRTIALSTELVEDLKWGCPCYTYEGKNIFLIHGFKEYCALLFFKGALMKDPDHILIQQTENVQAARQIRFTDVEQINDLEDILRQYMFEAVEIEESGAKVEMKKTKEFEMAEEFQEKLDQDPALQEAFKALTPGRQRAYLLYFSSAKQSKTRETRIEKCIPQIMDGIGLND
ncbi:YdeI/OmpD-associated family protein [Chryseobacterium sp. 1B4]